MCLCVAIFVDDARFGGVVVAVIVAVAIAAVVAAAFWRLNCCSK